MSNELQQIDLDKLPDFVSIRTLGLRGNSFMIPSTPQIDEYMKWKSEDKVRVIPTTMNGKVILIISKVEQQENLASEE